METKQISVMKVEEGDVILHNGELLLVEDLQESGRMNGVWLEFSGGRNMFFDYNDKVKLCLDGDVEEIG